MFNGLSLDQAPPLGVVLRFFITLPLFGIALITLMIFSPIEVMTPNHPYSLASIHLFFLGIATMGMIGAMFQMQSVLGGKSIPKAKMNGSIIHISLSLGTLSLAAAFITSLPSMFTLAAILLGLSLLYFGSIIIGLLFSSISHDTLKGMKMAVISLAITAILGMVMASEYAYENFSVYHTHLRHLHFSFGLIGWMAMLIIHVAFQVIEMFYVTATYSIWCKHNVSRVLLGALFLKTILLAGDLPYSQIADGIIGAILLGFIVTTLKRLHERKRRISDVSIWFWNLGLGLLALGIFMHAGSFVFEPLEIVALISFGMFILSIILGMMGKIIPFLVWFHLSSSGYMDAPIMSQIIPAKRLKITFWLFLSMAATAISALVYGDMLMVAGVIGILLFLLVFYNAMMAWKLYLHTLKHGTKFSFEV